MVLVTTWYGQDGGEERDGVDSRKEDKKYVCVCGGGGGEDGENLF